MSRFRMELKRENVKELKRKKCSVGVQGLEDALKLLYWCEAAGLQMAIMLQ